MDEILKINFKNLKEDLEKYITKSDIADAFDDDWDEGVSTIISIIKKHLIS